MSDVEILTPADLEALRAGYSYATMRAAFTQGLVEPYAPAGEWVGAMTRHFYDHEAAPVPACTLAPADRERVLLGMLCPKGGSELAIHVYWAMVVKDGLSPTEIADIFFLAGAYHGVGAWRGGLKTLVAVQRVLKAALAEGRNTTAAVLGQVVGAAAQVN